MFETGYRVRGREHTTDTEGLASWILFAGDESDGDPPAVRRRRRRDAGRDLLAKMRGEENCEAILAKWIKQQSSCDERIPLALSCRSVCEAFCLLLLLLLLIPQPVLRTINQKSHSLISSLSRENLSSGFQAAEVINVFSSFYPQESNSSYYRLSHQ